MFAGGALKCEGTIVVCEARGRYGDNGGTATAFLLTRGGAEIGPDWDHRLPPAEFWKKHDAGEFK